MMEAGSSRLPVTMEGAKMGEVVTMPDGVALSAIVMERPIE
jgi:hypothetical protein